VHTQVVGGSGGSGGRSGDHDHLVPYLCEPVLQ